MTPVGRLGDLGGWRLAVEPPVLAALEAWIAGQDFGLGRPQWMHGGDGNGRAVGIAPLTWADGAEQSVMVRLMPSPEAAAEYHGTVLARKESPQSFQRHFLETLRIGQLGRTGWDIHILEAPARKDARLVPLADLTGQQHFADLAGRVADGVVSEWKRNRETGKERRSAADYLTTALAGQLAPDGQLRRFAGQVGLDVDDPLPTVVVPRRGDLPNPLAVVRGGLGAEIEATIIFAGNGHGDLNVDTVVLPQLDRTFGEEFKVTGLDGFAVDVPVARDPMTLLLSIARTQLSGLDPYSPYRSNLAEQVVAPWGFSVAAPIAAFWPVASKVHIAGHAWAAEHGATNDWRNHCLLVLIGAALRNVGREGQPLADDWWYLEVAAVATRCLLDTGIRFKPRELADPRSDPRPADLGDFSEDQQLEFLERIGDNWHELVILFRISKREQGRWRGSEADGVWDWLKDRKRLGELPAALRRVGRGDLADMLEDDPR
jgi:hypothetical protein